MGANTSSKPLTKLGAYIKRNRLNANIGQHALAMHLGYQTPQFISNWERGISVPPEASIIPLAKALGVEANDLAKHVCEAKINKFKTKWYAKYNINEVASA